MDEYHSSEADPKPASDSLNLLIQLRNDFIDNIPPHELTLETPNYQLFKCRSAFFGLVGEVICELVEEGRVKDPDLIQAHAEYENYRRSGAVLTKDSPLGPAFRTKEDIDYVNGILDKFIDCLKS